MRSKTRSTIPFSKSLMLVSFVLSSAAHSQTSVPNGPDIVETTPNIIRKIGPYGSEMVIENALIAERIPCQPNYPQSSVKNGESGVVMLQLMINENGFVSRAKVAESSGFRDLDRAAMIGYLGCKFKPILQNGVPSEGWIKMRYVWDIR